MRHAIGLILFCFVVGCGARAKPRDPSATGGLSTADYAKLVAINEAQNAALTQVRRAAAGPDHRCQLRETAAAATPRDGWTTHTKVDGRGDGCPVKLLHQWTYDPGTGTLVFRHELNADARGTLVERKAGGVLRRLGTEAAHEVAGDIQYQPMLIRGVGPVEAHVSTAQTYLRKNGRGEVRVRVAQGTWSHEGVLRWRTGLTSKTVYEVDGRGITAAGFHRLFSAFGAPEIVANSIKMR